MGRGMCLAYEDCGRSGGFDSPPRGHTRIVDSMNAIGIGGDWLWYMRNRSDSDADSDGRGNTHIMLQRKSRPRQ